MVVVWTIGYHQHDRAAHLLVEIRAPCRSDARLPAISFCGSELRSAVVSRLPS